MMNDKEEMALAVGVAKMALVCIELDGRTSVAIDSCFTRPNDGTKFLATLSVRPMIDEEFKACSSSKYNFVQRKLGDKRG